MWRCLEYVGGIYSYIGCIFGCIGWFIFGINDREENKRRDWLLLNYWHSCGDYARRATMFAPAAILGNVERNADSSVIDLDNCRYVGAEVYTTDDDHTVFIDITSGDGALYAYDGQVDATAQYMLTLDAKTGDVLVVWQNVN